MKIFVVVVLCLIGTAAGMKHVKYSTAEREIIRKHLDCYLNRGSCDETGQTYKNNIPIAFRTNCATCPEAEKVAAYTFNVEAPKLYPKDHLEFRRRYDPQGNFDSFMAAISTKL